MDNDRIRGEKIPSLPTWVPDFSNVADLTYIFIHGMFNSAADTTAEFEVSDDLKTLGVRGLVPDELYENEGSDLYENFFHQKECWLKFAVAHSKSLQPAGTPWCQVFFRTLTGDCSGNENSEARSESGVEMKKFYQNALSFLVEFARLYSRENSIEEISALNLCMDSTERKNKLDTLLKDESIEYFAKVFLLWTFYPRGSAFEIAVANILDEFCGKKGSNGLIGSPMFKLPEIGMDQDSFSTRLPFILSSGYTCRQRVLFSTKRGYMGLAPLRAQKGDLVCIVHGCDVPLIIRRQEDRYVVIGDTYIYGMMNEEVIQDAQDGKLQYEDLKFI
jgi:hypothetical protein